jgi:hypothetical protein
LSWDCGKCIKSGDNIKRNCDGSDHGAFVLVTKLGGRFDRCPKSWLQHEATEQDNLIRDAYRFRQHGCLPILGGATDQPPRFWQTVDEIERQHTLIKASRDNGKAD